MYGGSPASAYSVSGGGDGFLAGNSPLQAQAQAQAQARAGPGHAYSQSVFTEPAGMATNMNMAGAPLGEPRRRMVAPRQVSMDISAAQIAALQMHAASPAAANASGAGGALAPSASASSLNVGARSRSNIVTGGLGGLAPVHPMSRHGAPLSPAALDGGDRSPLSPAPVANGSMTDRDAQPQQGGLPGAPMPLGRGHARNPSQSTRNLSPLRSRAATTTTPNATPGASSLNGTPRLTSPTASGQPSGNSAQSSPSLSSLAHASPSPLSLVPSSLPAYATPAPGASGILVALHVSDSVFLTTPETLLRAQVQEKATAETNAATAAATGSKGRAGTSGAGGGDNALRELMGDTPLLQWIGEDAIAKHRDAESGAPVGGGRGLGLKARPAGGSDSSPRVSVSSSSLGGVLGGVQSTVHQSGVAPASVASSMGDCAPIAASTLSFHAPTYSYFLDRSPHAYPLLLAYCRDGGEALTALLAASAPWPGAAVARDGALLAALKAEAEYLALPALAKLVDSVQTSRDSDRHLSEDDRFWADVVHTIDAMFPGDSSNGGQATPREGGGRVSPTQDNSVVSHRGRPISPVSRAAPPAVLVPSSGALTTRRAAAAQLQRNNNLQKNLGSMLRRLAFSRDELLRVCHASYRDSPDYEERLLEILHTTCTLCKRTIWYRPIGVREGRDTGCPVHPPNGAWDRKQRMWTCCGSPDFKDSGCQNTGVHYSTWTFFTD